MLPFAPTRGILQIADPGEYFDAYLARLEQLSQDRLIQIINGLPAAGRSIVFLCFEDIRTPGLVCHRQIFGVWIEHVTGVSVTEYRTTKENF